MSRKISILILMIIILSGLVYSYDETKTFIENFRENFRETQTHSYRGGTGQIRSADEFVVDGCGTGTVYDKLWDLCWEKDGSTKQTWDYATDNSNSDTCDNLNLGDYSSGWRLPTVKELMTLLYHNGYGTTYSRLNSIGFQNIKNSDYWSSEKYSSSRAYNVRFSYGASGFYDPSYGHYVLCVRNS